MSAFNILTSGYLPKPYYLWTVFNISDYHERTKVEQYRLKDITSIRNEEDRRFSQLHNLSYFAFDFSDCLKRTNEVPFDPGIDLDICLVETVYRRLKEYLDKYSIGNLVLQRPVGPKQHIDHRIVWAVGQLACKENKSVELFYVDDIPYSVVENEDHLIAKFILDDERLFKKHSAMEIYESQMCNYFHERVDELAAMNKGYERLFRCEV